MKKNAVISLIILIAMELLMTFSVMVPPAASGQSSFMNCYSIGLQPRRKTTGKKKMKIGCVLDSAGLGDRALNDTVYRGLVEAQRRLKIIVDVRASRNEMEEEENLKKFAKNDYDLVIAVGSEMHDSLTRVAHSFPRANFVLVDGVLILPNVVSLTFKEHEGSFLAGAAAALASKKKKYGFIGAVDLPRVRKYQVGYEEGIRYIHSTAEILVQYIGSDDSAWNDPLKARELALEMIDNGVDVIYHVAKKSGTGVIMAARERGIFVIGSEYDQDTMEPGTVLTSMVKRADVAIFSLIKILREGVFKGEHINFGVKEGGVSTTDFTCTRSFFTKSALEKLEEIKEKIKNGEIVVTDYTSR